jgi:preprotein translocase subunit SecG
VFYLIITIHLLLCVVLIGLVLLQQGKGAELGATLGGGSNTLFGAGGATSLVTKLTTGVAISFMVTSILLVRTYNRSAQPLRSGPDALLEGSLLEEAPKPAEPTVPPGQQEPVPAVNSADAPATSSQQVAPTASMPNTQPSQPGSINAAPVTENLPQGVDEKREKN